MKTPSLHLHEIKTKENYPSLDDKKWKITMNKPVEENAVRNGSQILQLKESTMNIELGISCKQWMKREKSLLRDKEQNFSQHIDNQGRVERETHNWFVAKTVIRMNNYGLYRLKI